MGEIICNSEFVFNIVSAFYLFAYKLLKMAAFLLTNGNNTLQTCKIKTVLKQWSALVWHKIAMKSSTYATKGMFNPRQHMSDIAIEMAQ